MLSPARDPHRGTRRDRCAYRSLSGGFVRIVPSACGSVQAGQLHSAARNPPGACLRLSAYFIRRSGGTLGDERGGGVEPAIPSFPNTAQIPAISTDDGSHCQRGGGQLRICAATPSE